MNLLIVESPSKAKTIEKYLGRDWRVVASVGHVRDLIPENGSVDFDNDFAMKWQIMPGKEKNIKQITDELKKADAVYLAPDPDREGEAIAWHLLDILRDKKALGAKPIYRVTFNEITKKAVMDAIAAPREIDQNLVDAYLVRRALDYLIGFQVSPLLWRRNLGRSVGRVQSVAVKLVVDREREIEAFKPVEYWSLDAECETRDAKRETRFMARLTQFNNEKIEKMSIEKQIRMDEIINILTDDGRVSRLASRVSSVEKKKVSRKPAAPFTTSTLQQEAARKLYFNARRTMSAAQKLYEQGLITYMRTDSTNLSRDAVDAIREFIGKQYGDKFLPAAPLTYATKSKNAQEAHEAVRPTDVSRLSATVGTDEDKLYDLIWKRTVACQMTNAEFDSVSVDIKTESGIGNPESVFHAVGTTRTFDGFMKVYIEDKDDSDDENESKLPPLSVGDAIDITKLIPEQHFTQPPARYTEASLVKKLEELGIGRPSTYATIMSTIVDRNYVEQDKQRRFHPTDGGWVVVGYLNKYFSDLVDVNFTAKTEDTLDDVSNGEMKKIPALENFWKPTSKLIDAAKDVKTSEIIDELNKSMESHIFHECSNVCPKCSGKLGLKLSKYGAFIGCENYPTCNYTQRLDTRSDGAVHDNDCEEKDGARDSGLGARDLGEGIQFKIGKYGPYVSDGKKNASAKKYNAETITLEVAHELLAADKTKKAEGVELGTNPATGKPIVYYASGRYGAYISSNKVNVSVKEQPDLDTAAELINNKKPSAKKSWNKK
ncbi:MAG: type I DNA topoisomerase [Rickettsiales bacterium]|jgi:DNA topoisomerase-1|nr:type I DNA topoisomerase [Rickettsiales bacterium]